MRLTDIAEQIHEVTGYTGPQLTQATLVAATLFADAMGRKDLGDYFAARAESYGLFHAGPQPVGPEPAASVLMRHKAIFGD